MRALRAPGRRRAAELERDLQAGASHAGERRSSPSVRCAPIAAKLLQERECCDVPIATDAPQQTVTLFDHVVSATQQRKRDGEAEHLCGLEVYDQLNFCGLLHWKIGWSLTLEHATRIDA